MKRKLFTLLLAMTLVLTACGGNAEESAEDTSTETSADSNAADSNSENNSDSNESGQDSEQTSNQVSGEGSDQVTGDLDGVPIPEEIRGAWFTADQEPAFTIRELSIEYPEQNYVITEVQTEEVDENNVEYTLYWANEEGTVQNDQATDPMAPEAIVFRYDKEVNVLSDGANEYYRQGQAPLTE